MGVVKRPNVEVRGSRSAKHGGNQQAQLVGCPARLQGYVSYAGDPQLKLSFMTGRCNF